MRRLPSLALAFPALALTTAACTDTPSDHGATNGAGLASAASACPAGATHLPLTGLCPDQADALLHVGKGDRPPPPENCQWTIAELAMPQDAVLLYRVARCGGKTTRLDYNAGKPLAHLDYAASAYYGDDVKGQSLIRFAPVRDGDPTATILAEALAAIEDPAEAVGCTVRKADIPGWPTDALVVDIPAVEAAKLPQDEIRSACGPLGLDQGSQHYWRAFQGFVWLFDLGQEQPDVDPDSLTLVRNYKDGGWWPLP
ncbi:MAG: hypothetical protein ABW039_09135 [Sphingobium sp.]